MSPVKQSIALLLELSDRLCRNGSDRSYGIAIGFTEILLGVGRSRVR